MQGSFELNDELNYLQNRGVQIMTFNDLYPEGHQAGISIIMHGKRIAANGDVRFEPSPGQWQPVSKKIKSTADRENRQIITELKYPDEDQHLKGFNPLIYPDFEFDYTVTAKAVTNGVTLTVSLNKEIPEKYSGKLFYILELFPGELFSKAWIMDDKQGIFPRQPNGPLFKRESNYDNDGHFEGVGEFTCKEELSGGNTGYSPAVADDILGVPYAEGHKFTVCPEDEYMRFTVESNDIPVKLYDGRMNHNNGWFVICSELPVNKKGELLQWKIIPNVVEDWLYKPVIQVSQIGYHPGQCKCAIIETDKNDKISGEEAILCKLTPDGYKEVHREKVCEWGDFLRYRYFKFDFSGIKDEGMYRVSFRDSYSAQFKIADDVYDRGVWQPVLEYFLPVQMCHMRVQEKYRLWHGHCHSDDARMAPAPRQHFDGYFQGDKTLTKYKPGDAVPGLNAGGWHDAGDFDLRVESQSGECYILASAYEEFGVYYDATTIDQKRHIVEIHEPDGKNDILQQIEHGALSVAGGYNALGRLYRGIICNNLRQYVLQGDPAGMTKGIAGDDDDRWVFTEDNPQRELDTAAHLAAVARVLKGFNDTLAPMALDIAKELFNNTP